MKPFVICTMPCTTESLSLKPTMPDLGRWPMSTSAMSPTNTGLPARATTTTRRMSSMLRSRPIERTSSASSPRRTTPPPALPLLVPSAPATWSSVSPYLRSRCGSTRTWYSFTAPPKLTTSTMPTSRRSAGRITQSCRARTSVAGISGGACTTYRKISPTAFVSGPSEGEAPGGSVMLWSFSITC